MRLREGRSELFYPFHFPYTENVRYHYYLAFLIEAVELFPVHMDLGFDALWRAFEAVCREDFQLTSGLSVKRLTPVFLKAVLDGHQYDSVLLDILKAVPVQSCKYIVTRLFQDWTSDNDDSKSSTLIMRRLKYSQSDLSVPGMVRFVEAIAGKYEAPIADPNAKRRAATLIRLALIGREVTICGQVFKLSIAERTWFLIGALLYTFRNDRFHANVQPPFKSSKGTLQTYAHVHYCFIACHLLLLIAMAESGVALVDAGEICRNGNKNIEAYLAFFGRHITR
jgi:hypothetical protein